MTGRGCEKKPEHSGLSSSPSFTATPPRVCLRSRACVLTLKGSVGVLNPLDKLGDIAREVDALLYTDFVSSAGGAEVNVHDWKIDLGLLGSQKVLSMPPSLSVVTVSQRVQFPLIQLPLRSVHIGMEANRGGEICRI